MDFNDKKQKYDHMFDFEHLASKDPFVFKIKWVEIIVLEQRNGHQRKEGADYVWKRLTRADPVNWK